MKSAHLGITYKNLQKIFNPNRKKSDFTSLGMKNNNNINLARSPAYSPVAKMLKEIDILHFIVPVDLNVACVGCMIACIILIYFPIGAACIQLK